MRYTITIDTDNAAFEGECLRAEIARILWGLIYRCNTSGKPAIGSLRDVNGNIVGSALYGPVPTDGNEPRF